MRRKFTDIVEFSGKACSSFDGKKSYISTGCVHDDHICKDEIEAVDYSSKPSRANLVVKPGDILFAKMQATKKTLLIDEDLSRNIYSTGFYAVKPKDGLITKKCLFYLINSSLFLDEKDKNCSGATQKAINNQGLSNIELNIPEFSMQESLTQKLDALSIIIEAKQSQIEYLDNLIKARFVEMFENNNSFDTLGNLAHFIKTGKLDANAEEKGGLYPFFTCDATPKTINTYAFDMEAILISGNGSRVGHVHYYSGKFNAYQRTYVIGNFDKNIDVVFLKKYLEMELRPYISKNKKGSAVPYITLPMLQNFAVPVPKIEYQKQFAAFVAQVDKSKFALSDELAVCDFYIRLIHDRVMHGRIDLRVS